MKHRIVLAVAMATALYWTAEVATAFEGWSPMPFCETREDGTKRCIVVERGRIRGSPASKTYLGYACATDDYSPEARAWNQAKMQIGQKDRSKWAPTGDTIMLGVPVWVSWLNRLGVRTRDPKVSLRWSSGQRERVMTRFERFDRDEPEGVVDLMWHFVDTEPFIERMKRGDRLDVTMPFFAVDPVQVHFRFVNAMASIQRAMDECGLEDSALGEFR